MREMLAKFGSNQQAVIGFVLLVVLLSFGLVLGGLLGASEWLSSMLLFVPGMLAGMTGQSTLLKLKQPSKEP